VTSSWFFLSTVNLIFYEKIFCLRRVYVGDEVNNGKCALRSPKAYLRSERMSCSKRLVVQKYIWINISRDCLC